MGILTAMNSAVGGLSAQSFALENISGNIANSSTTGFKRKDTSFADLVRSNTTNAARVTSGGVTASSRSTITLDGDVQGSAVDTHLAINGTGFFCVSSDPLDSSLGTRYTRAGDFEQYYDARNGQTYLRNHAGYSLMGQAIDQSSGNPVGSKQVITIDKTSQSAKATQGFTYKLNLPTVASTESGSTMWTSPAPTASVLSGNITKADSANFLKNSISGGSTTIYDAQGTPANVVLRWAKFSEVPTGSTAAVAATNATVTGNAALPSDLSSLNSKSFTVSYDGGAANTITIGATDFTSSSAPSDVVSNVQAQLDTSFGSGVMTASVDASGHLVIKAATAGSHSIAVGGTDVADFLGAAPAAVSGTDAVAASGPSPDAGRSEWGLFYQVAGDPANATDIAWKQIPTTATKDANSVLDGGAFFFDNNGRQIDDTSAINLGTITVEGKSFSGVTMNLTATEFADKNGQATTNQLTQDGYATGAFGGVSIDSNSGIISFNYSNGQTVKKWSIPIVAFNGASYLKAEDGGAYTETIQSGGPIDITGALSSSALEASNVDISEEFTKLIVTQQAFSANSKVITTANQMMSDILQIIR
jgi:flagellar hook protein FlgE